MFAQFVIWTEENNDKYNFLEVRRTILSNVWTDSNFI